MRRDGFLVLRCNRGFVIASCFELVSCGALNVVSLTSDSPESPVGLDGHSRVKVGYSPLLRSKDIFAGSNQPIELATHTVDALKASTSRSTSAGEKPVAMSAHRVDRIWPIARAHSRWACTTGAVVSAV